MATDRSVKVRLNADPSGFIAGFRAAQGAVRDLRRDIDTTNDRTAWLAQSFLALGPALGPISAAAVPALAGIATQMAVTGLAAGTLALAFNGIGDALKALNDYQIDPTEAHLDKLHETMALIGPTGRDLVRELDGMRDGLIGLANLSRDNMFPGVIEGLNEMDRLFPQVQQIVAKTSATLGELADRAGESLAGPEFEDFFNFLEAEAAPTLDDMARTIGNFAQGLGAMMAAFAPLSRDFSDGMLEMSRSFADWAHGLRDSESFQEFVEYVRRTTPLVLDLIAQMAATFGALVEAAAPVGAVMIPLLTEVLNVVEALVDTPLGPIFIAAAAAMSVYGRAVALASITTGGLFGKAIRAATGYDKLKASLFGAQAELVETTTQTKVLGDNMAAASVKAQIMGQRVAASAKVASDGITAASAKAAFFGESVALSSNRAASAVSAASTKAVILGDDLANIARKDSVPASIKAQIMFESSLGASAATANTLATNVGSVGTKAQQLTYAGRPVRAFGADLSTVERSAERSSRSVGKLGGAMGTAAGSVGAFAFALSPLPERLRLTNTAMGAMLGSFAGPVGTAIGAATGAVIDFSKVLIESMSSTSEFTSNMESLGATLDQQTGAITRNTEAYVENELAKQGVIKAARDIGISSDLLVDAYLGDELAIYRVNDALNQVNSSLTDADGKAIGGAEAWETYWSALELVSSALGGGEDALAGARDGLILTGDEVDTTADKFVRAVEKIDLFEQAIQDLDERMTKRSNFRNYQAAIDDLARSLRDNALFGDGVAFDTDSAKGRENQANLDAFVNSVKDVASEMEGVARKEFLRNAMRQFERLTGIAGLSKERTRELKRELGLLDLVKATPTVKVGNLELSQDKVNSLERGLRNLDGLTARPRIILGLARDTGAFGFGSGPGFAKGGYTGDAPANQAVGVVHGREFVHDAATTAQFRPLFEAIHKGQLRGYQGGGFVEPARMISVNGGGITDSQVDRLGDRMGRHVAGMQPVFGTNHFHSDGDYARAQQLGERLVAKGAG